MGLKARIISVRPNYVNVDEGAKPHPQRILGTWDVELIMVEGGDLTYEQACEYLRDQTDFELTPVEE